METTDAQEEEVQTFIQKYDQEVRRGAVQVQAGELPKSRGLRRRDGRPCLSTKSTGFQVIMPTIFLTFS